MSAIVVCTGCKRRMSRGTGYESDACLFCGAPTVLQPDPAPERNATNHERIEGGLTGVQIQRSEELLISIFGERAEGSTP